MDSIFHRISVRKYADKPVEKEKIMQILRAVRRKIASIRSEFILLRIDCIKYNTILDNKKASPSIFSIFRKTEF